MVAETAQSETADKGDTVHCYRTAGHTTLTWMLFMHAGRAGCSHPDVPQEQPLPTDGREL